MLTSNSKSQFYFDLINSKISCYKDSVVLNDIHLDVIECYLENNDELLSIVFDSLFSNLSAEKILELLNLNNLSNSTDITCEMLFNYCNFSFTNCLKFLDLELLDSVISEEECSDIIGSSFDIGYGNYLPIFDDKISFVIDSLDVLLKYKLLDLDITVKCRIEFDENDFSNHFVSFEEAEIFVDDFINDLLD